MSGSPSAAPASQERLNTHEDDAHDDDTVSHVLTAPPTSNNRPSRHRSSTQNEPEPPFQHPIKRTSTDIGAARPSSYISPPTRPRASTRWSLLPQSTRKGSVSALNEALWNRPQGLDGLDSSSSSSSSEDESDKEDGLVGLQHQNTAATTRSRKPSLVPSLKKAKTRREKLYSRFFVGNEHFSTKGRVDSNDGRLNISLNERNNSGYLAKRLGTGLLKHFSHRSTMHPTKSSTKVPLKDEPGPQLPRLNIVIMVIGSRGDIQPFLRLGKILKEDYGHRVRVATHPAFRDFVSKDSGLEFFSVGGDPSELMAFMVKNPGLIPSMETVWAGEIGRRREQMAEMFDGFWRACINATDDEKDMANLKMMGDKDPFIADAIIANPPSFAHIHCAEALGIPLHLMFTFPYTPTQAFPHPLANIKKTNVDPGYTNLMSYPLVEMMTWQGLGDLVNDFRVKTLGLDPVSTLWAPGQLYRLKVPYTYLWSPGLVPKPSDWGPNIDVTGFVFLDLATSFTPPEPLRKFLEAGEQPIYIGFGSIVVDDPDKFTEMIFAAVEMAGVRALVSKGWGGLGGKKDVPDNIFLLDNTPHDWLFPRVRAVIHHGGAGTTAIGLKCGKPTMIVPFFGDQQFWGSMVTRAGAGAAAVPYKSLTIEKLAEGIKQCLTKEAQEHANEIAQSIASEGDGAQNAVKSFLTKLPIKGPHGMRCVVFQDRIAAWRYKNTSIRLSPLAAEMLVEQKRLSWKNLTLLRTCEWNDFGGPGEPLTGTATAVMNSIAGVASGIGSVPYRVAKYSHKRRKQHVKKQRFQDQLRENHIATGEGLAAGTPADTEEAPNKRKISMFSRKKNDSKKQKSKDVTEKAPAAPPSVGSSETTQVETASSNNVDNKDEQGQTREKQQQETHGSLEIPKQQLTVPSVPEISPSALEADRVSVASEDVEDHYVEQVAGEVAHGIGRTGQAIVRVPMDISVAVAQGFHNAPRLYGDETVRGLHRITGIKSGLIAAGQEFVFGFYDGITGVVMQPYHGAKEDGATGFVRGIGMGLTGLVLKSLAAIIGPVAYTMKGMQKELRKSKQPRHHIRKARINQGQRELRQLQTEGDSAAAALGDYRQKLEHGWKVLHEVWYLLHEQNKGTLKGRIIERRERRNWRENGAFESIEDAEKALERRKRGESVVPVNTEQMV